MLLIPAKFGLLVVLFDFLILIIALLFRKSKPKTGISSLDRRGVKLLGYYATGSAIGVLVVGHYAFFTSYPDYFAGLLIDSLIFYLGLKVIVHE